MRIVAIKRGDTLPQGKCVFRPPRGESLPSPEGATASLIVRPRGTLDAGVALASRVTVGGDESALQLSVIWDPADVLNAAEYDAEFELTTSDGLRQTFPGADLYGNAEYIWLRIVPDLGDGVAEPDPEAQSSAGGAFDFFGDSFGA